MGATAPLMILIQTPITILGSLTSYLAFLRVPDSIQMKRIIWITRIFIFFIFHGIDCCWCSGIFDTKPPAGRFTAVACEPAGVAHTLQSLSPQPNASSADRNFFMEESLESLDLLQARAARDEEVDLLILESRWLHWEELDSLQSQWLETGVIGVSTR